MSNCITCKGLIEKLQKAKTSNDTTSARIAYDQMREHLTRVKYPAKHGFNKKLIRDSEKKNGLKKVGKKEAKLNER